MEEIQITLDVFRAKKNNIISTINSFNLVSEKNRKIMIAYIEEFYQIIENKNKVKSIFIDNARTK